MVTVRNLVHRYGKATVLQIPSLNVAPGDRWLIAGPSGSGKTTLLAILAGLLRPAQGTVTVGGKEVSSMPESALDAWRARAVGYVPQRLHLINSLTVLENLLLAQYLAGVDVDRKQGMALLQTLGIENLSQRLPHEISQGQAQRAAVARAVINKPTLLLADEPTAALDDVQADYVISLLTRHATAAGATLAVASHDARIRSKFEHVLSLPTEASA